MRKKTAVAWTSAIVLVTSVALANETLVMDGQSSGFPAWSGEADWANGYWKGECSATEVMVGVSRDTSTGHTHRVDCVTQGGSHANDVVTLSWPAGQNNCQRDCSGSADWDNGAYKATCPDSYVITGLAQSSSTNTPPAGVMSFVQCTPAPVDGSLTPDFACHTYIFEGQSDCGASCTGSNDWDNGFYKGQCAANEFLVGISRDVSTGYARAIQCCQIEGAT